MSSTPIPLMVVEDDAADRRLYRRILARADDEYTVSEFTTAADALAALPRLQPQCVVLDLNLPDGDGLQFIERARALLHAEAPRVVLVTAHASRGLGSQAFNAGASDFIAKQDLDPATLERAVRRALDELDSRRLRTRLEAAEKLAVVGRLAAGVVHDVSNPATFVQVSLDLLAAKVGRLGSTGALAFDESDATEMREMVADCQSGIRQISAIINELRAQTLCRVEAVELLSLDDVVDAARRSSQTPLADMAETTFDLDANTWFLGNRSTLIRVVTNLLTNATHATGPGGRLQVRTYCQDGNAILDVEDDGPGVPATMRARIFEPFYTTKTTSQGMGMGLSLCRSYVEQHAGDLSVDDSRLGGARFRVVLPLDNGLRPPGC